MLIFFVAAVCWISGGFYICLMRMNKLLNAARDESENENSTNIKLWGQNDDVHKENTKLKAENDKLKVSIGSQSIEIAKLTRALEPEAVPTESKETPKRKYTKRAVKK